MSSTDIDVVGSRPPVQLRGPANAAVDMLRAHAEVMAIAYDLASRLVRTSMVPNHYRSKVDDATAAILYGAELGLNPIQSLQQVAPINGRPSIEARTMVALLKAKGYRFKKVANTATVATIQGWEPGGDEEPQTVTWTIEDAVQAEFVPQIDPATGKYMLNSNNKIKGNMLYLTQPRQMLYAKASAELCRQLAPDVLLGIAFSREDMMDSEPEHAPPVRATSERITPADLVDTATPTVAGLPTVQWSGSDTFVGPPENPDVPAAPDDSSTPVVSDAAAENPESDIPPAEDAATAPATPSEQRHLSELLESRGHHGSAAKRAYLSTQTGRPITSATELTSQEAHDLAELLSLLASDDQIAALKAALANDHVHEDDEQIAWLQNNGAPDGFGSLDAALAEQLTDYLLVVQASDRETRA